MERTYFFVTASFQHELRKGDGREIGVPHVDHLRYFLFEGVIDVVHDTSHLLVVLASFDRELT